MAASKSNGVAEGVQRMPFPHDEADFANDERISFSKLDNAYILEDDDGTTWQFRPELSRWIQTVRVA
jgi:HIV Tat-specific factor 1